MLVENNLPIDGPVQPHGEGEGFPVTTKEYAVLQAPVGEVQAWIVQHRNQRHCMPQMVHMLIFTCLLFVCIWGWWLKTDASQTHAAEVEKKRQFVVIPLRTENLIRGVCLPFCWGTTRHLGKELGCIVHPVQLLQGCSLTGVCDYIIYVTDFTSVW